MWFCFEKARALKRKEDFFRNQGYKPYQKNLKTQIPIIFMPQWLNGRATAL